MAKLLGFLGPLLGVATAALLLAGPAQAALYVPDLGVSQSDAPDEPDSPEVPDNAETPDDTEAPDNAETPNDAEPEQAEDPAESEGPPSPEPNDDDGVRKVPTEEEEGADFYSVATLLAFFGIAMIVFVLLIRAGMRSSDREAKGTSADAADDSSASSEQVAPGNSDDTHPGGTGEGSSGRDTR